LAAPLTRLDANATILKDISLSLEISLKRRVAISILGTTLDAGFRDDRWHRWRPTVDFH